MPTISRRRASSSTRRMLDPVTMALSDAGPVGDVAGDTAMAK
jgi:hypothetical protein